MTFKRDPYWCPPHVKSAIALYVKLLHPRRAFNQAISWATGSGGTLCYSRYCQADSLVTASNNSTTPLFESVHPTTQRDLVSRFLCSAVTTYRVSTVQTSGCRARPRPQFEVRKSGNNALLSPQDLRQAVAHISLDLLSHISPTDCVP